MILRWLAVGILFLVVNAIVIVLQEEDSRLDDPTHSGLPQEGLILTQ